MCAHSSTPAASPSAPFVFVVDDEEFFLRGRGIGQLVITVGDRGGAQRMMCLLYGCLFTCVGLFYRYIYVYVDIYIDIYMYIYIYI